MATPLANDNAGECSCRACARRAGGWRIFIGGVPAPSASCPALQPPLTASCFLCAEVRVVFSAAPVFHMFLGTHHLLTNVQKSRRHRARCGHHRRVRLVGGGGVEPRDAFEGRAPQRRCRERLDGRLEEVAKAVGGGYCRLQMPLRLALAVRGTAPGHRLGALERGGGGGGLPMHHL